MEELDEEENSPFISVMPNLAQKVSPSKPDEHPTHNNTEMNSNKGIYEMMVQRNKLRKINTKINLHALNSHLPCYWSSWLQCNKFAPYK